MKKKFDKNKLLCNLLFVLVIATVLFYAGAILGSIVSNMAVELFKVDEEHRWILYVYLPFIAIVALVLLYTLCTKKSMLSAYFKSTPKKNASMIALGLVAGFVMNGLCILAALLNGDIRFGVGSISVGWLVIAFVLVFIQSGAEELLDRGYILMHLRERYGYKLAIIVSSAYFSALHIMNQGVTALALINIAVAGLFFAVSVQFFGNIWFAASAHAAWNFTQNFIFGLPNSGVVSGNSIFKLEAAKDSLLYDATFGVESTITTTIVNLVAILIILYLAKAKSKKSEIAE